jgi:hypothetical protein
MVMVADKAQCGTMWHNLSSIYAYLQLNPNTSRMNEVKYVPSKNRVCLRSEHVHDNERNRQNDANLDDYCEPNILELGCRMEIGF